MDEFLDKVVEPEAKDSERPKQTSKPDKRDTVEKSDAEGSAHVADSDMGLPEDEVPLTADVSADVAPAVGEFMDQAKLQNEAAAEAVPEVRDKPGSYISF